MRGEVRSRRGGALLAVDPAGVAFGVVLLLPDGYAVLDVVDDVAARVERFAAMRRTDPDPDRQIANFQHAYPVRAGRALESESGLRLR